MRGHGTTLTAGPSLVGCGLLLALALPATGKAAPQVALRPAAGPPGSTVTLVGSGFAHGKRITITGSGMRTHRVRSSAHGRYTARLVVPTRGGWLRLVSRRRHTRVVNRFRVLRGAAGRVVELASARGPRVRFSSTHVLPGAAVAVTAQGYRARTRLRLSAFGHSRHVRTRRTGRL